MGIIRNLAQNATNISYNIEDGTGMVDVRAWADNSSTNLMSDSEFQCVLAAVIRMCVHKLTVAAIYRIERTTTCESLATSRRSRTNER